MTCAYPFVCFIDSDNQLFFPKGVKSSKPWDKVRELNALEQAQPEEYRVRWVLMPCRKCKFCRVQNAKIWSYRCMHEASLYSQNCFLTLTYEDRHLPENGSLVRDHPRLFLMRLREHIYPHKIRYFGCGEYGSKLQRPHYHLLIYNYDFPDKKLLSKKRGNPLFVSEKLMRLWPFGFSTVGSVTRQSAGYVARYSLKKVNGDISQDHYGQRLPEFLMCSLKPGIGADWYEKYKCDVYPQDYLVVQDKGKSFKTRPPRYYDKLHSRFDPEAMDEVKQKRIEKVMALPELTQDKAEVKQYIFNDRTKRLFRDYEEEKY